jgi:hypothetical protein
MGVDDVLLSAFLALTWPEAAELALIPAIAPTLTHTVAKAPHMIRLVFISNLRHFRDLAAAGFDLRWPAAESLLRLCKAPV